MLDCVVVGAGLAGLAAARDLVGRGKNVIVLEARDRVGGRIETVHTADGASLDLGGQSISEGHELMNELLAAYDLGSVDATPGDLMVLMNGHVTRVHPDSPTRRALSPFELSDLGQALHRFRRLATRLAKDAAWAEANKGWFQQPFLRWVESNLRTSGGQSRFIQAFSTSYDVQPESLLLSEALAKATSGVDLESLVTVEGGVKQYRIAGGLGKLTDIIAAELGERVILDSPVVTIRHNADSVSVVTASGETFDAKTAIVTLPPRLAMSLEFDPPLPPWRPETANKMPPGNVIKAFLVFRTPWWRERGLAGKLSADEGPVRVTFDASPEFGVGVLMGFFEGEQAATLGARTASLRRRAFEDVVEQILGESPEPAIDYVERDWLAEPYTAGCHGAHFSPGIWTAAGSQLGQPEGRVYFAGAEYAHKFNGYLEGAVHSAKETVNDVVRALR